MNHQPQPPAWVDALVEKLAPAHLAEEIHGDLYEIFLEDAHVRGTRAAKVSYAFNALGFLTKRFFWKQSPQPTPTYMLRSYFTMATRSLRAYKSNTAINILGLVVGMASALVILTVIHFEWSFDTFHSDADKIYRVVRVSGDDMSEFRSGVSYPVPGAFRDEIATIKKITVVEYFTGAYVDILDTTGNSVRKFREDSGCGIADDQFFSVFDFKNSPFKWLAGNPATALAEPNSVVLTRSLAKKYFGDEAPLGRTVRFEKAFDCKVTGVVEDLPANTDFPFTMFASYTTVHKPGSDEMKDWTSVSDEHQVFIIPQNGVTKEALEKQMARSHAAHTDKELHTMRHYLLQPLRDVHYDPKFGNLSRRTITKETLGALGLVALFLLLTASINYVNLCTAQSTLRAKEIGLRKVMGSNRRNLTLQFLTETFLIVLIAGILAFALAEMVLFNFQSLFNLRLTQDYIVEPFILLSLGGIILGVTLLAGLYPSLVISRFNPIAALKNSFGTERMGGFSLRKVLVVVQFTITQLLVVGTYIVVTQMRFFQNADMGFTRDAIVTVKLPDNKPTTLGVLEDALRSQAFVSNVSYSYTLPSGMQRYRSYSGIGKPDAKEMKDFLGYEYVGADENYLTLYDIRLLAGRNLLKSDSVGNIVINNALVKALSLGTPQEAIGASLKMNGKPVTVVGVINDYYSDSMKSEVGAIVLTMDPGSYAFASIKLALNGNNTTTPEAVRQIEKLWSAQYPDFAFTYSFFDENVEAFYQQERRYAQLFQMFSLTFLVIGCLGLYGLITFVVNRKGKEMAIRKVLGASINQILYLFSREYVLLILLSFVIATPIAYYAVNSWLSNFANHIDLSWWLFLVPGLGVLAVALLVVTTKSVRTANANPVDTLKYE